MLNYADKICYTSCPQATFASSITHLIGEATSGTYPGYFAQFQTYCVPCPTLCMECVSSTRCNRCYQVGRNESYLLNHTCYQPTCPYGYY